MLTRVAVVLFALLLPATAHAQFDDEAGDYDVVIEVGDGFVTYNGDDIEDFEVLQKVLSADVEATPELTVKLLAHADVRSGIVMRIYTLVSELGVECELETIHEQESPTNGL